MPVIIESLRKDHRNFEGLLQVLEQELAVFDRAERPDYEILTATVRYFQEYPECCHHPKEDAVFAKMKERNPAAAEAMGDLEAEHAELAKQLRDFARAVDGVLGEQDVPREIYFHRNAVADNGYHALEAGQEVRFSEDIGDKGPQATIVQPIGKHHLE